MKKLAIAIFLCVVTGLSSCNNMHKQMKQLFAKEIIIPREIPLKYMGKDTLTVNPISAYARLIVYVDSLSCSSCRISHIYQYDDILSFREYTGNDYAPVFMFSPKSGYAYEIIQTLKFSYFDYPILLDDKGLFPAANPHIPADSRFHTFLLDKNGKVVLVGNPVNNPQLWELYKTTITQIIENGGTMPDET